MFFPLENTEKQDLERQLQGYQENREEKLKFVAQIIDQKIGEEAKNNENNLETIEITVVQISNSKSKRSSN